ncbi:MAG: tetratricopeptide repeat protein [Rikenellaceae bacterium]|nr:tetratricopeptide repeat protein [Rikenellaceae bacterium]
MRRGFSPSKRLLNNKEMAHKKHEDPEVVIENAIGSTEAFFMKNGKKLLILTISIIAVVGCFFVYRYMESQRNQRAATAIYPAEQMFRIDSFEVALNGNNEVEGFLSIIDQFGSTDVGNTANHYAGICYMKLGDWDNAIKYLSDYKSTKGIASEIINAENRGLMGDAFSQKKLYDKAAKEYEAAVNASDNILTTPIYLKKAGLVYEKTGKTDKALEAYKRIKNSYPSSLEARDIDKYISQIEK